MGLRGSVFADCVCLHLNAKPTKVNKCCKGHPLGTVKENIKGGEFLNKCEKKKHGNCFIIIFLMNTLSN